MRLSLRSLGFLALGVLVACATTVGCGEDPADEEGGAAGALRASTGVSWIVETDPDTGALVFAAPKEGPLAAEAGATLDVAARAFLKRHQRALGMHDPLAELEVERVEPLDGEGGHVRFVQKVLGVPVSGATWTVHFDGAAKLTSMTGDYFADAHLVAVTPAIAKDAAARAAQDEARRQAPELTEAPPIEGEPQLVVLPMDGARPALAWSVSVGGDEPFLIEVDATSGAVLRAVSAMPERTARAKPPQSYAPFSENRPELQIPISDADPPRLYARGVGNVEVIVGTFGRPNVPIAATAGVDVSRQLWADATRPAGAAVAAMANVQRVLSFFGAHRWGPQRAPFWSYDGRGSPLWLQINWNKRGITNASFDVVSHRMSFGDGDARFYTQAASVDTTTHELVHGIAYAVARLDWSTRESGALHESFGDVFAALRAHADGASDESAFAFVDDDNPRGQVLRNMRRPDDPAALRRIASHVSEKDGKAHHDSGIASHAFYLLTHGGTHARSRYEVPCGIGWGAADRLYWRVLTTQVQPRESFKLLAQQSLATARQLAINTKPVACAWVAVGVLSEAEARKWNVTCSKSTSPARPESDNVLVDGQGHLVECPQPLAGPGVSLTQ